VRYARCVAVLIGLSIVPAGCSRPKGTSDFMTDFQRMQGAWKVEKLEQDGERAADASLLKMIIIKGDRFTFRYYLPRSKKYGDLVDRFTLDSSQTPRRIETKSSEDGSLLVGIYELEADTLKVCWNRADPRKPPADFTCSKGSNRRLLVLKRAQSKPR
jgi:uncharacterized protein (TIGR03067 family)